MSRVAAVSCVLLGALVLVSADPTSREQVRLRAHFDSVLIELRARDLSTLSGAQRAARYRLIEWLAQYRDAGRFPLNDRYANGPTPIFRDARGATCAMAYLIERSGRADIVDRIAETWNLAYIRELADEKNLVAWLDSTGLSAAEAARIQPAYGEPRPNRAGITGVTVVLSGMSLATTATNVMAPREIVGLVGVGVGVLTVLIGGNLGDEYVGYSRVNLVSGWSAIAAGMYAAFKPRKPIVSQTASLKGRFEWVPLVAWTAPSGQARAGFMARF